MQPTPKYPRQLTNVKSGALKSLAQPWPQRINTWLPHAVSLLALIISILSYVDSKNQNAFQNSTVYTIDTKFAPDMPLEVALVDSSFLAEPLYSNVADANMTLGFVSTYLQVDITNTGSRAFAIEDINAKFFYLADKTRIYASPNVLGNILTEAVSGLYSGPNKPITLPITVEQGHQERIFIKVIWPIIGKSAKALTTVQSGKYDSLSHAEKVLAFQVGSTLGNNARRWDNYYTSEPLSNTNLGYTIYIKMAGQKDVNVRDVYTH